jgi:flagellar protein FliO/FliZ
MHHRLHRAAAALVYASVCGSAQAADAVPGPGIGSLLQMILGLGVVLAAFFGVMWLIRRSGALGAGSKQVLKLVSSIAVGTRERVVIVEIGEQWIVAGVAPGRVSQLACLPRGEIAMQVSDGAPQPAASFAGFLRQVMEKRNVR